MELTDKLLPEELPQPRIFNLLVDFLEALEKREKKHGTIVMAYIIKVLDLLGTMPELDNCVACGKSPAKEDGKLVAKQFLFSVKEGGMICPGCAKELAREDERPLIYKLDIGIIDILKFFQKQPMSAFEKIALDDKLQSKLQEIIKEYISYHLDISGLKSESFF